MSSGIPRHDTLHLYDGDGPFTVDIAIPEDDGGPKDLTGATAAYWWIYADVSDPVVTLELDDGLTIPSPETDGVIVATLSQANIAALGSGVYRDRLRIIDADGIAQTVLEGVVYSHASPAEPSP